MEVGGGVGNTHFWDSARLGGRNPRMNTRFLVGIVESVVVQFTGRWKVEGRSLFGLVGKRMAGM